MIPSSQMSSQKQLIQIANCEYCMQVRNSKCLAQWFQELKRQHWRSYSSSQRHVGYPYPIVHCWVDCSHDWHAGWCVICQIWDDLCVSCNVFYELRLMRSSFHNSYIDSVFYECGSACVFPASTQLQPDNHIQDTEIPSANAEEDQDSLSQYAVADSGFSNLPVYWISYHTGHKLLAVLYRYCFGGVSCRF